SASARVVPWLAVALAFGSLRGSEPARAGERPESPTETTRPGTGTIEGKVLYKKDPARPWRLGRYYIKNARSGELAEAVVALSRRGLKAPEDNRQPATVTVDQKDFQFTPETIAIRAGDHVRFLNSDDATHNVRLSHLRLSFNVNMPAGGEHVEKFPVAGGIQRPFEIGCVYHGAMRSWVFVFDHPWFQLTGSDGAFRLTDIPPGEYRLEVVHPAGSLSASRTITVEADKTVTAEFLLSPDDLRNAEK
ncbi:MAG TPA: carboxypeptidase regulatory-like domain-containing protein, partial [Isosphaeraceae bacterium]|nr:carboxypeptidase regulatory-like domain-containing protein [Isosphaeraceae bacterium]